LRSVWPRKARRRCLPERSSWEVKHLSGKVRELHERSTAVLGEQGPGRRAAHVCQPRDRALVLGSTQGQSAADLVACAAGGFDVVRRRSGGGAVLVEPGQLVWVDLFVPAGDPLWRDDVGQAAWWVGEAWAGGLEVDGAEVWKSPMQRGPWSSLVCFAGLGPGEVTLSTGEKVVGISQRRGRRGALFQCSCPLYWDAGRLLSLLALSHEERVAGARALEKVAAGVASLFAGERASDLGPALAARLVAALPE